MAVVPRVDVDDVDLTEDRLCGVVDLRPAGPDQSRAVGIVSHQEAVEVDPVGGHALVQLRDGPATLLGVVGKGPIVGLDPCLLVAAGDEGPRHQGPGRRHDVGSERQRDPHLEQVPLGDESLGGGPVVVGGGGLHDPQVDGRPRRHLLHRPPQQCRLQPRSRLRGVDGEVQHRRAVTGRGQDRTPSELLSIAVAGEDDAFACWCLAVMGGGQQLRFGERRVPAPPWPPGPGARAARHHRVRAAPAVRPPSCPHRPLRPT